MRIALISDIHANVAALEAVLAGIKKHAPDMILSLGDQVNLGPNPRETMQMLREHRVKCLHGNHERYILSVMAGDPAYEGANFNCLRFQKGLLTAEEITHPKTLEMEGVTFCHAMPEDDRFPVYDVRQATPLLRAMDDETPRHIICGHGHNPVHYQVGNIRVDCIGSVGCMDEGIAGAAPFTILDMERGAVSLQPFYVPYDRRGIREQFVKSGMVAFCPIMAHISFLQMTRNRDYLMGFVALAREISQSRGEAHVSEESWQEADARFPWPDGMRTTEFWASKITF